MPDRMLVVSEFRFFREALTSYFAGQERFGVVEGASPGDALALVHSARPDVVLLHLDLVLGAELIREVILLVPETAIIAIVVDEATQPLWQAAGAAACAAADSAADQLASVVWTACRPSADHGSMAGAGLRDHRRGLTVREQEVASLVSAGLSNKEIARALSITVPTVKNHVHSILEKLDVDRRCRVADGRAHRDRVASMPGLPGA